MELSVVSVAAIMGAANLLIFGTLIVLGLTFGRRSGGFLAAGGLLVMLLGSFFAGMLISQTGDLYLMALPSILGMLLITGGVGMNAYRHRMAEERT